MACREKIILRIAASNKNSRKIISRVDDDLQECFASESCVTKFFLFGENGISSF